MCAIVGGFSIQMNELSAMCESMRHRGPDDSGQFQHLNFAMGMVRLSIQDPANGQQPFASENGEIQVICNGEIYNWRELRVQLEKRGYSFQTQCDGEILPACWQVWGPEMFAKLNGMFAIAIYDVKKAELILARDQCGQKPLYYTPKSEQGRLLFASEIRAFKEAGVSLSPNREQMSAYLMNRYVSEPDTLFKEVNTVPAAHWMKISIDGVIDVQRYWKPENVTDSEYQLDSLDDALQVMDEVTEKAVSQTLQNEWKSVLFLSSGVDSNLLAQYMSELGGDISSISIGFNSTQDETKAAEQSAKIFGIDHQNILLNANVLEVLPRVIGQMERPVGDALILAFDALAKGSKDAGARVAYGAEGIDEHFGGYSFHKAYFQAVKLGKIGRKGASSFLKYAPNGIIQKLASFPASLGDEGKKRVSNYLQGFDSFSAEWQADYLRYLYEPGDLDQVMTSAPSITVDKDHNKKWSMNGLLARQYDSWLQDWSLIRQDKNTMAHSIEFRCPFLDPELIKFAFSLRDDWKITSRKDKLIWRQLAEKKLPSEIAWRPKVPFYLPLEQEQWRKKLVEMSHDVLNKSALDKHGWLNTEEIGKLQNSTEFLPMKKLASLLIFQIWYDNSF